MTLDLTKAKEIIANRAESPEERREWKNHCCLYFPDAIAEIEALRKRLAEHEHEAGLWDEQHAQQHRVNTDLSKRLELAEAVCILAWRDRVPNPRAQIDKDMNDAVLAWRQAKGGGE